MLRPSKVLFLVAGAAIAVLASSCKAMPYRDDVGFLVSAQANSPEFPVYLNGKLCTDMEGLVGLCSKRIRSNEAIRFRFDAQPYAWTLTTTCTAGVKPPGNHSVAAGQSYSFTMVPEDFSEFRVFTCIGEVSPQDRDAPISARFRVTFVIVDADYLTRERAYLTTQKGRNYLVFGQYARSAWVLDSRGWWQAQNHPIVQVQGPINQVKGYSESYAMRYNYLNMGAQDAGPESE